MRRRERERGEERRRGESSGSERGEEVREGSSPDWMAFGSSVFGFTDEGMRAKEESEEVSEAGGPAPIGIRPKSCRRYMRS